MKQLKKLYQIEEFFPAAGDSRFKIDVTVDEDTLHVVTPDQFKDSALYDYGERSFLCFENDIPLTAFYNRFSAWFSQREYDITKEFEALRTEYKPLENYNSVEEKTGSETGLQTPTNWKETKDFKVSQDYKIVDSQKPNNWKETVDHKASLDYKETDSQKPTNWKETKDFKVSQDYKETDSQKPNQWKETVDHKVSEGYKETDSEKPSNWKETKNTSGTDPAAANTSTSTNSIMPFNGSAFIDANKTTNVNAFNETSERTGTYDHEHTQTGIKTDEKTQSGTFDTEHTQTGTRTEETAQSGTFDVEHTQTGIKTDEKTQSGTFDVEHTQTGTRTEETAKTGTYEDKMTYNTKLTRAGNIGTVTSQSMLLAEVEARSRNYARELIKEFFDMVTVYA